MPRHRIIHPDINEEETDEIVTPNNLPLNDQVEVGDKNEQPVSEAEIDRLEDDQAAYDDVSRVLTELGADLSEAKIQVWRIKSEGSRDASFIASFTPLEFSLERLAEDFGGGIYDIRVYVPRYIDGERRGVKLAKRPRIKIDGPPKVPVRETPAKDGAGVEALAKAMMEGFREIGQAIIQSRPKEKSVIEIAQELKTIKDLFSSNEQRPSLDPLAMLQRLLEIQEHIAPRPTPETDTGVMLELVRTFAPLIRDGIARLPEKPPETAAIPTQSESQAVVSSKVDISQSPKIEANEMDALRMIYTGYVKLLADAAARNDDPLKIAQEIYENAPDSVIDLALNDANFVEKLAQFEPRIKLFPVWLDKVKAELKKLDDDSSED